MDCESQIPEALQINGHVFRTLLTSTMENLGGNGP